MLSLFFIPVIVFAQLDVNEIGLFETAELSYGSGQRNIDVGTFLGVYIIRPLLGLVGIVYLVQMVYAGVMWMTDQGNLDSVAKAKKLLIHATVGMIIIVAAFAITNLLLEALSGVSSTAPPTP